MLVTDVNRDLEQNEWHFAEEEREFFRHTLTKENRINWLKHWDQLTTIYSN